MVFFFTYLTEKNSEHPLAKAINDRIAILISKKIDTLCSQYTLKEFKNRDGEGVVATIINNETGEPNEVLCGNDKLL